jgi:hypothetical protein
MKLSLALACCLALAAGCKSDSTPPAAGSAQSSGASRSGRIDMPRPRPKLNPDGTDREDKRAELGQRRSDQLSAWDADGDGKLSDAERAAMHKERALGMHARFDLDGDGKLTPEELSKTRWFGGAASTADTNGDGDISPDELQKALDSSRPPHGPRPQFRSEGKL